MLTYAQVDELLTLYPLIRTRISVILCEFQTVVPRQRDYTPDEVIAGLALASKWPDDMPHPPEGNTSDKTASVAAMYRKVYEDEQVGIDKDRIDELLGLYEIINKIEVALRDLPKNEQKVIRLRYFEKKSWEEISCEMGITRQGCNKAKRRAINRLQRGLYLSEKDWQIVNNLQYAI